jgi:hypothetical protein
MLGHAMDFYIPDVPLEQIRFAGLRLQRGGVGFYPTSGSPFVHLDTGNIRHWPRMTHDQLARVFPDGRTVHVPTDGKPLKGYELALADIEKRGGGGDASTVSKPSLFASLFRGKSNDEEDEGASAEIAEKPAGPIASAATARSADAVPVPRTKPPVGATFQLASADAQIIQSSKAKPAAPAQKAEAKPQTPADIINARGFWGDTPAAPKQATPAQVAAISARQALAAADPQPTASVSALQAMAYAPAASSSVDHSNIVAAGAPIPRSFRASASRNAAPATGIDTIVSKGSQGQGNLVATSTRLAAAGGNSIWMRVMMLAPSASSSMNATVLGDADMTVMRVYFVKPQAAIAMTFSDDPQMGMVTDRFSGSATAKLTTQSFVMQTASLR